MKGWIACALAALLTGSAALADTARPDFASEERDAWAAASKAATHGPADIRLRNQAHIVLAPDQLFIPEAQANRVMTALGNAANPNRAGLVVSDKDDVNWIIDVEWTAEGYVKDGDAKEWQADELLASLKEGTQEGNKARVARGRPELEIVGWIEPPAYDSAAHRLIWSLSARHRGAPAGEPQTVNYNAYALGRDGYFSFDLLTSDKTVEKDKLAARALLDTLTYEPGKTYEDFNASTDKIAAYGLAALVGGVAVKKLGLMALAGVFMLKIWKLAIVGVIAVGAGLKRLFGGKGPKA